MPALSGAAVNFHLAGAPGRERAPSTVLARFRGLSGVVLRFFSEQDLLRLRVLSNMDFGLQDDKDIGLQASSVGA